MDILEEEDALAYCGGRGDDRDDQWEDWERCEERPVHILPWFELCRAIHYAAVEGRLEPGHFRVCWNDFASRHAAACSSGNILHLLGSGESEDNLLLTILTLGPIRARMAEDNEEVEEDARSDARAHRALTARLRRLHEGASERIRDWGQSRLCWGTNPPEEMPDPDQLISRRGEGPGLVLDTNVALELFNKLPVDGNWTGAPSIPQRLKDASASMVREIQRLLAGRGAPGKLILPASVLEEADRVIQRKSGLYRKAGEVLHKMARANTWPLRSAFYFEPLSMEIFNAFLYLHERLRTHVDAKSWPRFADALVMAHGIYNRCPVASTEWEEGRTTKMDWEAVRHIFPFLVPR